MPSPDGSFDLTRTGAEEPAQRPGLVRRDDMLRRLNAITHAATLVELLAPAGYGKTTVLSQWAAQKPHSFAWVTLEDADNDPVRLVRQIVKALQRIEPVPDATLTSLASRNASAREVLVPALLAWLGTHGGGRVLVLDDLHRLRNPVSLGVVEALVRQLPPGWHLAIASRTRADLLLGPLRRQYWYVELGPQDLIFSEQEAKALLSVADVEIPDEGLQSLIRRTEAWPAGLYLAALSLRASRDPEAAIRITGDDERLGEYFREQVLDREDAETVQFLLRTAVLERLSGPLCDAVLATTGAGNRLADLVDRNLFVVPQDQRGHWYRYHRLFAELLRAELGRREPGVELELHRRAAVWFSERGLFEEGISHALAGRDVTTAARLASRCAQGFVNSGRIATLRRWIDEMGDEGPTVYPPLAVSAAWVWALEGEPAKAAHSLRTAENATFEGTPSDGSSSLESGITLIRSAMAQLGLGQMLHDSRRAVELEPPGSPWHPLAAFLCGSAELLRGDRERAIKAFQRSAYLGRGGQKPAASLALAQLSLVAAEAGDWPAAAVHARAARELLRAGGLRDHVANMVSSVATANVATHEGDRETALLSVANALRLDSNGPSAVAFPWLAAQTAITLGRILLDLDDPQAAALKASEARRHLGRFASRGILLTQLHQLTSDVAAHGTSRSAASSMALTQAQLRVLQLLPTHLTLAEIAIELDLSRDTVKTHVAAIYRRLQTTNRSDTVQRGQQLGLLDV